MINIGIILSDSSIERSCLGLALELEELINSYQSYCSRLIDLQDYTHDEALLKDKLKVDAVLFLCQESNSSYSDCVSKMIGNTYPMLKDMPTGIIVNAKDIYRSEAIGEKLQKVLLCQDFIVFHKKMTLSKIQQSFNSSYEIVDRDCDMKLKQFIEEYLLFVSTRGSKSQSELLSETH